MGRLARQMQKATARLRAPAFTGTPPITTRPVATTPSLILIMRLPSSPTTFEPNNAEDYAWRGACHREEGDRVRALAEFDKIICRSLTMRTPTTSGVGITRPE
jgi:hypothetical protein